MLVINGPALFSRRKEKSLYSRIQIFLNMICSIILCAMRVGKSLAIFTTRQVLSFVPSNISYELNLFRRIAFGKELREGGFVSFVSGSLFMF